MTDPVARLAFFIDRNSLKVIRDPEAEDARAALDLLVARCEQAEARVAALTAQVEEPIFMSDHQVQAHFDAIRELAARAKAAEARIVRLEAALREIEAIQPSLVEWFRETGVVFKNAPRPNPDTEWEVIAFAIYGRVVESNIKASAALAEVSGRDA